MSSEEKIVIQPIGYVKNEEVIDQNPDSVAKIVVKPELAEALFGIEGFSHVFVLFYFNQLSPNKKTSLKIHPKGRADLPLVGIWGTRTMYRPNLIGLTLVKLIKAQGNVLFVKGLDARDGTPILDIKPYDPEGDATGDAKVPEWWQKL